MFRIFISKKRLKLRKKENELAPWISSAIDEAKKWKDVDFHIISPHHGINGLHKFSDENIHYYFFNPELIVAGHSPKFLLLVNYLINFYFNRKIIIRIVKNINPDIVNLHGIENPYYASSIFRLKMYPILITIQGLVSLHPNVSQNWVSKFITRRRIQNEQRAIKEFSNFGIRVRFLEKYIRNINPGSVFFWFKYPFGEGLKSTQSVEKTYDCVFFSKVVKEKGIEDLIDALFIVKKELPTITLKVIGNCSQGYKNYLADKIKRSDLNNNIEFVGFLPNHEALNNVVSHARVSILPTYNDILPGTIIESLKLGIPVIAYAANGVVDFNEKIETINLIEVGNISELAKSILNLLADKSLQEDMILRGLEFASQNCDNSKEFAKMLDSYTKVIQNHKND